MAVGRIVVLALLVCVIAPYAGLADEVVISTIGKGVGKTADEALKDSFRDAVERAVGVFVDAEQMIENDKLIHDGILTHSNAYIEKYRKVAERSLGSGLLEVKIIAEVKKGELTRKIKDTMPEKHFSLGDALKREYEKMQQKEELRQEEEKLARELKKQAEARDMTKEKRDADAAALVKNTLEDFNPSAMMLDITATGAKPTVSELNGDIIVGFDMCLKLSKDKYFTTLVPRLKQLLGQIALQPPKTIRFILKRQKSAEVLEDELFYDKQGSITVMPLTSIFKEEIEVGGTTYRLPYLSFEMKGGDADESFDMGDRLIKDFVDKISGEPIVWVVDKVNGSGDQMRVTMTGYVIADACIEALKNVVSKWKTRSPVEFVAELVDSSGEMVTAQTIRISTNCGWIGWGGPLKCVSPSKRVAEFENSEVEKGAERFYVMPWMSTKTEFGFTAFETVPFKCGFKVLADELKSASSVRVRIEE